MFILRTILEDNTQTNSTLGEKYDLVEKSINYKQFSEIFKHHFKQDHATDLDGKEPISRLCYGFVGTAPNYIPLWATRRNYIMTDTGKTFAKINER